MKRLRKRTDRIRNGLCTKTHRMRLPSFIFMALNILRYLYVIFKRCFVSDVRNVECANCVYNSHLTKCFGITFVDVAVASVIPPPQALFLNRPSPNRCVLNSTILLCIPLIYGRPDLQSFII